MMMENGRIMVRRPQETKAIVQLLHNGTTSKYANCLLWTPWKILEDIQPIQDEEETDDQKKARLSIFPLSVFPCIEEDD